ncbi:MAG: hypothetical protein PHT54_03465 [Candidatus Nanoarchaeia archaeon]|nr:hypothetical protein [Candidatus Nanoarchaeia archaeon]
MKQAYITLRDRMWKGKEWYTSFRSHLNIRKLTDEEAKPFLEEGSIEKVIPKKPYKENVVGNDNGKMVCKLCGSRKGFYVKKFPFGHRVIIYTCAECGERQKGYF